MRKAGLSGGLRIKLPGRKKVLESEKSQTQPLQTNTQHSVKPSSHQRAPSSKDHLSALEAFAKKNPRQKQGKASAIVSKKRSRPVQDSEALDSDNSQSKTTPPPPKRPRDHHRKPDEDVDPLSQTTPPPVKRPRGRPRKSEEKQPEASKRLAVHVYVQISRPPKVVLGKTHKGDKYKAQKPRKEGPFTLTLKYNWQRFLTAISETVDEDLENLLIDEMVWTFSGKKNELPLTNKPGFKAMMEQLDGLSGKTTPAVILHLPAPLSSRKKQRRAEVNSTDDENLDMAKGNSMWAKKAGRMSGEIMTAVTDSSF